MTPSLIAWARTGSLMWMTFGLACCAIEKPRLPREIGVANRIPLSAALPAVLSSVWLGRSLCHDAAAAAVTTPQALHVGRDWRFRVEAETSKSGAGQTSFMPAMQAAHDHQATNITQLGHSFLNRRRARRVEWPAVAGRARDGF
jgi:hypothetical protein